jgi:hypothetical protein
VTEFLLDAVSNAGRSGKMDLFSYVPPDYIKPGHDNNGTPPTLVFSSLDPSLLGLSTSCLT